MSVVHPADVERELIRLSNSLDESGAEVARLLRDHAEKEAAYRRAYNQALVMSTGRSAEDRKAEAANASEDAQLAAMIALAELRAAREVSHNARCQLEALRSVNANTRYAAGLNQR